MDIYLGAFGSPCTSIKVTHSCRAFQAKISELDSLRLPSKRTFSRQRAKMGLMRDLSVEKISDKT